MFKSEFLKKETKIQKSLQPLNHLRFKAIPHMTKFASMGVAIDFSSIFPPHLITSFRLYNVGFMRLKMARLI